MDMKKFGLFLLTSLLLSFAGCNDDTVEEQSFPTVSKPVLAVTENTSASFSIAWDAVEGAEEYLYSVSKSDADGNTTEVRPETRTAATLFTIDDASAATRYTVRVKTIAAADSQLGDSDFAEIFLETPAEGTSVQTFRFGTMSVTYSSLTVTVTPALNESSYCAVAVKTALLLDKNSNEIVTMVKESLAESSLKQGEKTFTFEQLDPSTSYTVVAFGYNWEKGVSTSQLFRSEAVKTADDVRPSLDLSVLSTGDTSISVKCTPSDTQIFYYMTSVPSSQVNGKSDYDLLDEQLAALDKQGWDAIAGQLRKGASTYTASSLTMGTEYTVFAFGLQKSATGGVEALTRLFRVDATTTRPEPLVTIEETIEDGDKYALSYPEFAGKAVFSVVFKPNDVAAKYYYGFYNDTVLDSSEEELYAALMGDPGAAVSGVQEVGVYVLDWGEKIVVGVIGIDAAGNPGPMTWETFTMTKEDQGGSNTPGGNEPVERGNASVEVKATPSNGYHGQEIGTPMLIVDFTPSSDCVEYRFMVGMNEGTYDSVGGEDGLIAAFENESFHDQKIWESSNDYSGNSLVYSFYDTVLGKTIESYAVAYDAEGRPGKVSMVTTSFPSSVDDLEQLSRPYPGSTFLSTPLSVKSKMDLLVKKPNTALLQLMRNN